MKQQGFALIELIIIIIITVVIYTTFVSPFTTKPYDPNTPVVPFESVVTPIPESENNSQKDWWGD